MEILRLPGVEPKDIVAFTFTEKAAAELKERVTDLTTAAFPGMTGLAELFIGTMHGYARDLLQTWVPEAFKRNVLSDVQARLFIDRNSRASGLTVVDAVVNGVPKKLKRFVNSPLYMQVLGILREDDVDEDLLPDRCPTRCSATGSCCGTRTTSTSPSCCGSPSTCSTSTPTTTWPGR